METMPVAITIAKMFGGSCETSMRVFGEASMRRLLVAGEEVQPPQQHDVQDETRQAGDCGRPDDRHVAAQPGVHGGGEEPELKDHEQPDGDADTVDDRVFLLS